MATLSRLLDEVLPLDEATRREWLDNLPPEHRDLAPALREVLLPGAAQAANFSVLSALPKLSDYDPILNALHGDPRFKALLRKMNLPES